MNSGLFSSLAIGLAAFSTTVLLLATYAAPLV